MMKTFCTRLAESGLVAFAPDLYHDKAVDVIADAEALGSSVDANQTNADIAEAIEFLSAHASEPIRGLAVVGSSLGAFFALELWVTDPEHVRSVVLLYRTRLGDHGDSKAAYLGHIAEMDDFEPQSKIAALEPSLWQPGRPVQLHHYADTGHWFFEPDRVQALNQAAASLA